MNVVNNVDMLKFRARYTCLQELLQYLRKKILARTEEHCIQG